MYIYECIYIYMYICMCIYKYVYACVYIYMFFHSHGSKVGITYCSINVDGLYLFFTSDDNLMVILNCLE